MVVVGPEVEEGEPEHGHGDEDERDDPSGWVGPGFHAARR
jgi:hypothetical protein